MNELVPNNWFYPYKCPCENAYEDKSINEPDLFINVLESNILENSELTFALEYAGKHIKSEKIVPVLIKFLKHNSIVVKEGALIGAYYHMTNKLMCEAIDNFIKTEPCKLLVDLAVDMIVFY